ncbi:response regulator [Methylocaldum sp.]|uniref:response regulator n=1 Tax=Methylocaldum sp. TaxID=1969727 RepID=UPI002D27CA52|nr:response regulator [Methylocaldum sp.]HYE36385.1 response regulator [Methylocaldum sp.]
MKTILVVENELSIRQLVVQLLELEGYSVLQAENGLTAVEVAETAMPDLILCDLLMPELDGYGVLRRLQENPATASIPLVFLTASAAKTEQENCLQQGAAGFMIKPFHHVELLDLIRSFLPH